MEISAHESPLYCLCCCGRMWCPEDLQTFWSLEGSFDNTEVLSHSHRQSSSKVLDLNNLPPLWLNLYLSDILTKAKSTCHTPMNTPLAALPVDLRIKLKWKLVMSDSLSIFQATTPVWVAGPFYNGSSQPRDRTWVFSIAAEFLTSWTPREAQQYWIFPTQEWNRVLLHCRQIFYQLSCWDPLTWLRRPCRFWLVPGCSLPVTTFQPRPHQLPWHHIPNSAHGHLSSKLSIPPPESNVLLFR